MTLNKEVPCNACGIYIGPGFINTKVVKVGQRTLCEYCANHLKKYGFLKLENHDITRTKIMKEDGTIEFIYNDSKILYKELK